MKNKTSNFIYKNNTVNYADTRNNIYNSEFLPILGLRMVYYDIIKYKYEE